MINYAAHEECFIDLSNSQTPADLVFALSSKLESRELSNKKLQLDLGNLHLNDAQILSLKTLIENAESEIAVIYTESSTTQISALNAGITVSDKVWDISLDEEEEDEELQEILNDDDLDIVQDEFDPVETTVNTVKTSEDTLYIKQTLRSGQIVTFDGNVVIIGDCHPGSEIVATGDITVWGVLSGIAHAGAKGNINSKIRALRMNAIQLRIADYYARRPDQVEIDKMEKTPAFIPEEAKVSNGEIVIYTLNS